MRQQKLKTLTEIYEQGIRVFELLKEVTRSAIKRADPRTGGDLHLAHNWGTPEAKRLSEQFDARCLTIHQAKNKVAEKAFAREYPLHQRSISSK